MKFWITLVRGMPAVALVGGFILLDDALLRRRQQDLTF